MSIYEVRAIVEDRRSKCVGGINVGLNIFCSSIIPMIFYNSESWVGIQKRTFKILMEFFCRFFRCLYRIGAGAPIPNFFWQAGLLMPEYLILQRKLNFYFHLANLPDGSLAKEVFTKQKEDSLGGLVKEIQEHTDKLGDPTSFSKQMWKKMIIAYIKAKNKEDLLKMVSNYKKLDYMQWKDEEFERKEFFQTLDLEGIRWMMRITSGMVNTIHGNFKQK